jgi:hypothetical protein
MSTAPNLSRAGVLAFALTLLTSCDATLSTGLAGVSAPITFSVREIAGDPSGRPADPVIAVLLEIEPGNSAGGCAVLEAELGVSPTVVTIHLVGVRRAACAPDANSCSCTQLYLPRLAGDYELRIVTEERTDRYALAVTTSAITITPKHVEFTTPRFARIWRYPESSFAAVCYTGAADAAGCDDLDTQLAGVSGLTPFTFPEGGELPYPKSGDVQVGAYRVSYWRYLTEDAYARAGERMRAMVPRFKATYPTGFLYLTNWRGVLLQ